MAAVNTSTGVQGGGTGGDPSTTVEGVQRVRTPGGIPFINSEGELGIMSGRITPVIPTTVPTNWVQRLHPLHHIWVRDELKSRASYLATRQHLTPFLVPHRFEGPNTDPGKLPRSKLAYGVGLNQAYLQEILGHIRATPAHYIWGPLGVLEDKDSTQPPKSGIAEGLWWDASGDGKTWTNFFEGEVLEWVLTSPGGLILVDTNNASGLGDKKMTQAAAEAAGIRSSLKFIPFSWVEDYGHGPRGFRWIKIAETVDEREPDMPMHQVGFERRHVLYKLLADGRTEISRWDNKGKPIGAKVYQTIKNKKGQGILPLIPATFGEHPDIHYLGTGLLMGLDDVVIDIFNLLTEIREGYRDTVFTFLTYRGGDADSVREQLESGTRLVSIGDEPNAELKVTGPPTGEVDAGLKILEVCLKNWALSAKRRAMEQHDTAIGRSGVAIKAEFQLDLVPLMISVTERLDALETQVMFILAQIEGKTVKEANTCSVRRETEFQMEQEASRIARIVGEFMTSIPGMPAHLLKEMIMRWAESIDFLDLDQDIKLKDGTSKKLRDVISDEADEVAEADQKARMLQNQLGILGNAGMGAALGGVGGGGKTGGAGGGKGGGAAASRGSGGGAGSGPQDKAVPRA